MQSLCVLLLDGEKDPLLEDSQEELMGIATAPPAIATSRATLAVAVGQGSEEGRQYSERPCQGLPTFTNNVPLCGCCIIFKMV